MDIIEIFNFAKIKKIIYNNYFEQKIEKENYFKNITENLINIANFVDKIYATIHGCISIAF